MFYAPDKKLLFVHVPKTAGTSIKIALKPYASAHPETLTSHPPMVAHVLNVSDRLRARGMLFPNHMTYCEVKRFTDIDRTMLTAFSVVRNPWSRLSSLYRHIARDPTHNVHDFAVACGYRGFLEALLDRDGRAVAPDTLPQIRYLLDCSGSLGVRTLLKQEQLLPGLRVLCDRIGLRLVLPRANAAPDNSPTPIEDTETHKLVAAYEAGIIRLLGYSEANPEGLGGAYVELREKDECEQVSPRPQKSARRDIRGLTEQAMSDLRLGHAERAAAALENGLAIAPDDPVAIHSLGLARHNLNDRAEALRLVRRSVELAPEQPEYWRNLGSLLKSDEALPSAAEAFERAVSLAPRDAEAWALLCDARFRLNKATAAREAGQRALELKDEAACAGEVPQVGRVAKPFEPQARRRNVIAMSLFGPDPYYHEGARLNAILARTIYPEWMCRYYCDASIPKALIRELTKLGAQVVQYPKQSAGNEGLFWRFRVANDPDVDRFLCRDCDSPFTVRERVAVEEWIALGTPFHVMRDHVIHTDLILAGLWGGVAGLLPDMDALAAAQLGEYRGRWADQKMLGREIWPRIRACVTVHDSHYRVGPTRPFPRFGALPPPLHAGFSRPREEKDRPGEFQLG